MPRPSCPRIAPAEQLELRILPTVKVTFNPNSGLLKITGDNAENKIEVEGLAGQGVMEVFVDDVSVGEFDNVVSIKANLKGGDDGLFISAIQIPGRVIANLGDGADELDIDDSSDNVTQRVEMGGILKANLGNNAGDLADFDGAILIGNNVTITGVADVDFNGDGADFNLEIDDDITFISNLTIKLSGLGDVNVDNLELDFDNVNVQGTTTLDGSNNTDRFEITSSSFEGNFNANMDDGDDTIDINNGAALKNAFNSAANFRGGDDNDTLLKGLDNLFAQPELVTGFETVV